MPTDSYLPLRALCIPDESFFSSGPLPNFVQGHIPITLPFTQNFTLQHIPLQWPKAKFFSCMVTLPQSDRLTFCMEAMWQLRPTSAKTLILLPCKYKFHHYHEALIARTRIARGTFLILNKTKTKSYQSLKGLTPCTQMT